ncbi:MAG: hypothetical protein IRZ32_04060 [Solirubrobacteraceae bacterium]|nr:hypothetical protein [Solirubrobacteraceae bacterium]
MRFRPVLACAVAACALTAALPAAASAAPRKAPKVQANTAQTNAALEEVRRQVAELRQAVNELKGEQGGVAAILAAAPAIIDGMTQLKNGLETLAAAYQAVEYGIVQANVVGGGTIVNPPSWTGDIPDDGNGTTTSGTATLLTFGPGGAPVTVTVNAYVRSNEANLSGESGPVAQAGATLTVRDGSGSFLPCAEHGATGGVAMTPTGETIQTPTGPVTNLPLTNIRSARPRTDQTLPGTDAPLLVSCTFTSVAGVPAYYTLEYTASFLDIPRTTTPGPRD